MEDIEDTRTKTRSPQTNGICERFQKTVHDEFYFVTFRKKIYTTLEELQADLDAYLEHYNTERTHQGSWRYGRLRCRRSWTAYRWPGRRYCRPRGARPLKRTGQREGLGEPTVRPNFDFHTLGLFSA